MSGILEYSVLDVFAERALEGNQLAVFHDGRDLSTAQMLAIAQEMNLSESVFVLPEDAEVERREGVRVRIFTTQEELPFAGHPTLGAASWLYANHATLKGAEGIVLRENIGPIPVTFAARDEHATGVYATMRQNDPVFGDEHDAAEVAAVIGICCRVMRRRRCLRRTRSASLLCGPWRLCVAWPFRSVRLRLG
jgi:trans-2,3-dihydro-3-hydroxyanthranilate isomerase